jgi:hypothetical protein
LDNSKHNWCFTCSRDFATAQALNQVRQPTPTMARLLTPLHKHLLSPGHSKEKNFDCLICDRAFKTPSAVAMHIESGCHNITRHQVTAFVHELKVVPTTSVSRRLKGPILPSAAIMTSATQLAFNGYAYECYLCHHTFMTLERLNAHLNSPAHDADEFKCLNPACKTEFKLISGLIQHIESGSCGLVKFNLIPGLIQHSESGSCELVSTPVQSQFHFSRMPGLFMTAAFQGWKLLGAVGSHLLT